jgi:DNA-binding CsgD family transcriptional regulator
VKKQTYLYCGVIALSFLWTGSAYISLAYRLMVHYTPYQIDLYQVVWGYLLQVLGMVVFALGVKKRPEIFRKNLFFAVLLITEAIVISVGILSNIPAVSLCFGFVMNLLHGVVAGWYLTQLSAFVPQQYRGRVFGFGYAIGSVGSWVLSLPFQGQFLRMEGIIPVYIILIALTWFVNMKATAEPSETENVTSSEPLNNKGRTLLFLLIILLTMTKTLGFYFPAADVSNVINLEFSRAFYAAGLAIAGIINDKNRRYGAVCCVAALAFSFISYAFYGNVEYTLVVWILGYIFFGFFSVYRVVVFSDIAAQKPSLLYLAAFGLIAGRIGDSLGTYGGMLLSQKSIPLLTVTSGLFILVVFLFFTVYNKIYVPAARGNDMERRLEKFSREYSLTTREKEVLRLVIEGKSNMEISGTLFVSESTVKFHVGNILKKAGCTNRTTLTLQFNEKSI